MLLHRHGSLSMPANAPGPAPATGHRYWRLRSTDTHVSGEYLACADLQLRDIAGGADLTSPTTPITASIALSGYPATQAIDADTATFWTTGGNAPGALGHWLRVDFGASNEKEVVEISYRVRPDTYREDPANLFIESSDDDATWTERWSVASIPTWAAGETRVFTAP